MDSDDRIFVSKLEISMPERETNKTPMSNCSRHAFFFSLSFSLFNDALIFIPIEKINNKKHADLTVSSEITVDNDCASMSLLKIRFFLIKKKKNK